MEYLCGKFVAFLANNQASVLIHGKYRLIPSTESNFCGILLVCSPALGSTATILPMWDDTIILADQGVSSKPS